MDQVRQGENGLNLFKKKAKIGRIIDVYSQVKRIASNRDDVTQQGPHSIFLDLKVQGMVISKKTHLEDNAISTEKREVTELVISDDSAHIKVISDYREDLRSLDVGTEVIIEGLSANYAPAEGIDDNVGEKTDGMVFSLRGSKISTVKEETVARGLYVVATVKEDIKYDTRSPDWGRREHSTINNRLNSTGGGKYGIVRKEERYEISWEEYLGKKGPNQNVVIAGGSGYGKTTLIYWLIRETKGYKKVIFAYKNSDEFDRLGYPVLRMASHSPNVFGDKEAFTQAWMVAFGVREQNSGITASQIESTVRRIVSGCGNWSEFSDEVVKLKKTKSLIEKGVLSDIEGKMHSVFNERMWSYDLPQEICIDFSGLNEEAFTFYCEYLLRSLYREMSDGRRERTQIVIDEGHKFLNSQKTIVRELAAMIRSRGSFIISTQKLHSLKGIRGNASMQFSFRLTEAEDLLESKALSNEYQWILQRLYPREFVDLGQYASEDDIYVFSLRNPSLRFYDTVEWNPEEQAQGEIVEGQEGGRKVRPMSNLELDDLVYSLIAMGARTKYEVTKEVSSRIDKSVGELKLTVMNSFDRIARQGRISSFSLDGVKVRYNKIYSSPKYEVLVYFRYGTYDGHDYVVKMVARILEEKGYKPDVLVHRGESSPDLVVKEQKLAIEVEMGTKFGYKIDETRQRIEGEKREGYRVLIMVPTDDLKEKYNDISETYTPRELWEHNLETEQ